MNEFLQDIQELLPKVTKRKGYLLLCSLCGRSEKYWNFWVGKRDWYKFNISERQMLKLVKLMIDYWFLEVTWEVIGSKGFKCRLFKASKTLREVFEWIRGKVKLTSITERIREFNERTDIFEYLKFEYLKGSGVVKYGTLRIWDYICTRKTRTHLLNIKTRENITLFEYLRGEKDLIETCKELNIIW